MRIGVQITQGWKQEFVGWRPAEAWDRTVALARQAERLGFESLWVADHFHTRPDSLDEITFESFTTLAALASLTGSIRLGHLVACAGFRNPALTAKMASSMDVVSGGRYELGIGAGWKEDEWLAYGYVFPPLRDRITRLGEQLEVIRAMLEPGRATVATAHFEVRGAINEPKGIQAPRIPLIVGGNGRALTRRLAARFADELSLAHFSPEELRGENEVTRRVCEEVGRDPATLRVSLFMDENCLKLERAARVDLIGAYASEGLDRLITFPCLWSVGFDAQEAFADDCREAGVALGSAG